MSGRLSIAQIQLPRQSRVGALPNSHPAPAIVTAASTERPLRTSATNGSRRLPSARPGCREATRTVSPASRNWRTTRRPRKPVPPNTVRQLIARVAHRYRKNRSNRGPIQSIPDRPASERSVGTEAIECRAESAIELYLTIYWITKTSVLLKQPLAISARKCAARKFLDTALSAHPGSQGA